MSNLDTLTLKELDDVRSVLAAAGFDAELARAMIREPTDLAAVMVDAARRYLSGEHRCRMGDEPWHSGHYVAISYEHGGRIIAVGTSYRDAKDRAIMAGDPTPFVVPAHKMRAAIGK